MVVLQEQECFAKAASLDTHKALVHIFFAQRSTKKARASYACHRQCHPAVHYMTAELL